jgi:hypothetical protein
MQARSTLSTPTSSPRASYVSSLEHLKSAGYHLEIVFLRVASTHLALKRIAARVRQGGPPSRKPTCCAASSAAGRASKACTGHWRTPGRYMKIRESSRYSLDGAHEIMSKSPRDPQFTKRIERALIRAGAAARTTARRYGTPIYSAKMGRSSRSGLDGPLVARPARNEAATGFAMPPEAAKVRKVDELYLGANLVNPGA